MTITISSGTTEKTLNVVPGTFKSQDKHIDAGGNGLYPLIRTNLGRSGSCEVILDSSNCSLEDVLSLISGPGAGNFTLSEPADCRNALVDITIAGDGVQTATITWNGIPPQD